MTMDNIKDIQRVIDAGEALLEAWTDNISIGLVPPLPQSITMPDLITKVSYWKGFVAGYDARLNNERP
jgi:hypothetical protein